MKYLFFTITCFCLLACKPPKVITVPHTPEGNACVHNCLMLHNECRRSRGDGARYEDRGLDRNECYNQQSICYSLCPGAFYRDRIENE